MMKLADIPSCLGGGESGINVAYRVDHKMNHSELWLTAPWVVRIPLLQP